ncbi:AP-4 complex accessory subunit Tepsin-like isoform X1 [Haliotis rufescens]|uniref:AP-4 complex accessory subunit Tepsin-like isoform X1 n=1 Tax=Haliotis rufescens TaxID=6454 RepID=UPI00201E86ED|nr:AP-4 complex accessory subunit Tepsin-like isoform X1 [Haliotis rufescens]
MNSPESVNLVSQRISFVNKISTLLKATSDDDKPIPGYLYNEISGISHESVGYCESLLEYLVDRLEKNSYHVKLKVLKVMRYTVDNGHPNFKAGLMRTARGVRAATKYGGPPDPLHGNIPYIMVRKVAQELCEVLFEVEESSNSRKGETTPARPSPKAMMGLGPSSNSGKMEGFGNSPQNQPTTSWKLRDAAESLGDTIIDGISRIAEKMAETDSDRQRVVLANLDGSSGQYQPPVIMSPDPITTDVTVPLPITSPVKKTPPKHVPGKAGGGWDDDPPTPSRGSHKKHSDSGGSSDLADRLESVTLADWSTEENLVTSIVDDPSCLLLTQSQLAVFQRRCSRLNSEKVLDFIIQRLTSDQEPVIMKSMLLLETYLRSDLVNLEYLVSTSEQSLLAVHGHWTGPPHSKARKIIRILEKLTSHTSILPDPGELIVNTDTDRRETSPCQSDETALEGGNSDNLELLSTPLVTDDFEISQDGLLDNSDDLS